MTAKGHAALATALVEVVKAGPKKALLALPPGRSWPPTEDELQTVGECNVKGSSALKCSTKLVREWLWVSCDNDGGGLDNIGVTAGGHGDAYIANSTLLIPIVEGDATRVRYDWRKGTRELKLDFPVGGQLTMAFVDGEQLTGPRPWNGRAGPGDPLVEGSCREGRFGGALHRCAPACDDKKPCSEGHCEPWPTGAFCAVP